MWEYMCEQLPTWTPGQCHDFTTPKLMLRAIVVLYVVVILSYFQEKVMVECSAQFSIILMQIRFIPLVDPK